MSSFLYTHQEVLGHPYLLFILIQTYHHTVVTFTIYRNFKFHVLLRSKKDFIYLLLI